MLTRCSQRVMRKIDYRANVSQANKNNFLENLKIITDDFNLGNAIFKLSFVISDLPSQLVSKRLGSDVWVPTRCVSSKYVRTFTEPKSLGRSTEYRRF